ncbi:MAG: MarR family transcriptional regulator [Balneolaceae bacterium]
MGTHFKGSTKELKTLNAFIKLVRSVESLNSAQSKSLAKENLTISQFGALEALLHLGPLNQREIGKKLLKSGGNITLVIDNLEKRGLVKRKADTKDRRAVIVSLTAKGRAFIEEYFPKHLALLVDEFSVLTDEEKDTLASLCKKLGLKE